MTKMLWSMSAVTPLFAQNPSSWVPPPSSTRSAVISSRRFFTRGTLSKTARPPPYEDALQFKTP